MMAEMDYQSEMLLVSKIIVVEKLLLAWQIKFVLKTSNVQVAVVTTALVLLCAVKVTNLKLKTILCTVCLKNISV